MTMVSSNAPRDPVPAGAGRLIRAVEWLVLRIAAAWPFLLFFVGFFLFWEYAVILFGVPGYILPTPSEIVTRGWADIPRLLDYTLVTGTESVLGYLLAVAVGLPIGLAIAFSPMLRRTVYPFFVSLEMVPKIAFAPLFIAWLGFGLLPKVIIVVLVCFFPVALNSIHAFGSLSDELTRFCRSTGAGPLRTFWKVRLPAALPQCFVGFKYAALNATVGATIAEFMGSDQGLGFYISIATGNMRPDLAFAGIFFLTLLGLALFGCVTLAERLLIPWHISQRRH
ncbi:NitT/TauT family transport system permease protein [Angulomicrobium tetraedrale]|uniref:NitT/TauT family transport system permease protein n=2 Tax=Ancylobacter tetraedralis TaxID=217068 RepID=A0A839ZFK7_9HYPH|nr:NitT/TauT family transport system permease protein [Ancylobacter tetraedralis]